MSPSKVREAWSPEPVTRHRAAGRRSWSRLPSSFVRTVVSALVGCAAPILASPFPADRDGLSCGSVGPYFERSRVILAWAWSSPWSVGRVHVGPFASAPGRLPWGLSSASRRPSSESTVRRASQARLRSALSVSHALDGLLLAGACRLVSSCCHVPDLRSGLSPRPSCATSSVAMPSRRWRRASVAGCPTTPSRAASTSGPCSRSGFRGARRRVSPSRVRVPIALSSFGLVAADLASAMNRGSTLDLVARCYESGVRWSWRFDRPTASMLYR